MTNGPIDQPMSNDELRALVASNARAIAGLQQKIDSNAGSIANSQKLIDSNARAIQALNQAREADNFRVSADLLDLKNLERNNSILMGQLTSAVHTTSTKVDSFVDEGRADRAEARRERQQNADEHAAFRESFQSMLGEIMQRLNQIWERLSA
ncbi:MAG: hypothetical protein AAF921_10085 [Cyanobacteria bacterium P01_D01_bin.44]